MASILRSQTNGKKQTPGKNDKMHTDTGICHGDTHESLEALAACLPQAAGLNDKDKLYATAGQKLKQRLPQKDKIPGS